MPKQFTDPKILLLNVELELKSEKDNAEVRIDDPDGYQVRLAASLETGLDGVAVVWWWWAAVGWRYGVVAVDVGWVAVAMWVESIYPSI